MKFAGDLTPSLWEFNLELKLKLSESLNRSFSLTVRIDWARAADLVYRVVFVGGGGVMGGIGRRMMRMGKREWEMKED